MRQILSGFLVGLRRFGGETIPAQYRHNWIWDLITGILAGIYHGSIWTFAFQVARGELKADATMMGYVNAAPAVGFLFATFWARQMEGRSKLPFVTITWILSRGMFLLTPLIVQGVYRTQLYVFILCLTPVLFSVSTPAYTAIMKEIYPDSLRGKLMSYVRIGMMASMILTARIMGWWQEHGGLDFRWMFAIGGAFGVATALSFSRLRVPEIKNNGSLPPMGQFLKETFGILHRNRGYRWFTISVFITGFGNLVATTYYPIYQVDKFRITPEQIATMSVIFSLAALMSLFFWGWFLDKFGSLTAVLLAVGINCLTPVGYALGGDLVWLYIAGAASGFAASGIELGYLNTTLLFAEEGKASQYQALHSSFFGLRGTIAPLVAVQLIHYLQYRWQIAFLLCLALMLLGLGFQTLALRTYRKRHGKEEKEEAT